MKNYLNIGIIGAGFISDYHINGLREVKSARIKVICAPREKVVKEKAEKYQIKEFSTDYREVLERKDIDAVIIATPDFTHHEIAIASAQAGKHIMLQKPMARNVQECNEIIEAAKKSGVKLFVSFMHRYFPETQKAKEYIKKGKIGDIFLVRMRNATSGPTWRSWFYKKNKVNGGAVLQLGVHGIDLIRYLIGEVDEVFAVTDLFIKERVVEGNKKVIPDNEDTALAIYQLTNGVRCSHEISMSQKYGCDRFTMEIYGSKGTIWLRTPVGPLAIYSQEISKSKTWTIPELPVEPFGYRHHYEFIRRIMNDMPPDASGEDGLATVQVAEAIYRSRDVGHIVKVKRV